MLEVLEVLEVLRNEVCDIFLGTTTAAAVLDRKPAKLDNGWRPIAPTHES